MNGNFTALDFETAQGKRSSICQIGIVVVKDYEIEQKVSILVQPPENKYSERNTEIHGITALHTESSLTFDKAYPQIREYIEGKHVVAHNMAFDLDCLKKTMEHYNMVLPDFQTYCTYKIFGSGLAKCCEIHGIELNHHEAVSDAEACAKLFVKHLKGF